MLFRSLAAATALVSGLLAAPARAEPKPLVIPQVEGERQGRIVGRAIACGAPEERTSAILHAARERMLRAVGGDFTETRYLPELSRAIQFETSLPKPSEAACVRALEKLGGLEAQGPSVQ